MSARQGFLSVSPVALASPTASLLPDLDLASTPPQWGGRGRFVIRLAGICRKQNSVQSLTTCPCPYLLYIQVQPAAALHDHIISLSSLLAEKFLFFLTHPIPSTQHADFRHHPSNKKAVENFTTNRHLDSFAELHFLHSLCSYICMYVVSFSTLLFPPPPPKSNRKTINSNAKMQNLPQA